MAFCLLCVVQCLPLFMCNTETEDILKQLRAMDLWELFPEESFGMSKQLTGDLNCSLSGSLVSDTCFLLDVTRVFVSLKRSCHLVPGLVGVLSPIAVCLSCSPLSFVVPPLRPDGACQLVRRKSAVENSLVQAWVRDGLSGAVIHRQISASNVPSQFGVEAIHVAGSSSELALPGRGCSCFQPQTLWAPWVAKEGEPRKKLTRLCWEGKLRLTYCVMLKLKRKVDVKVERKCEFRGRWRNTVGEEVTQFVCLIFLVKFLQPQHFTRGLLWLWIVFTRTNRVGAGFARYLVSKVNLKLASWGLVCLHERWKIAEHQLCEIKYQLQYDKTNLL